MFLLLGHLSPPAQGVFASSVSGPEMRCMPFEFHQGHRPCLQGHPKHSQTSCGPGSSGSLNLRWHLSVAQVVCHGPGSLVRTWSVPWYTQDHSAMELHVLFFFPARTNLLDLCCSLLFSPVAGNIIPILSTTVLTIPTDSSNENSWPQTQLNK